MDKFFKGYQRYTFNAFLQNINPIILLKKLTAIKLCAYICHFFLKI